MDGPRPTVHIDTKKEHLRPKGIAVHLVGPTGCAVLVAAKAEWNCHCRGIQTPTKLFGTGLIEHRLAMASNRHKVILFHNNTRPHVAKAVKDILLELEWEALLQLAYSPDIALSDYHLFRSMRHELVDTRFWHVEEVRKFVNDWIAPKLPSFFRHGIAILPERWENVVGNDGKYFD